MSIPFKPADILLPDFSTYNGTPWSCVACDQYTSQPAYWESADATASDSPSTLRLIIPEVYLAETETRKPNVLSAMEDYLKHVLVAHPHTMILVERTLRSGETRWGLVGAVDLLTYDYRKGADSLIRATEATVAERIPARTTIRRDAPVELPHVMMLIDDRQKTVIEPLAVVKDTLAPAYDHDLMQNSGHLKGYFLTPALMEQVDAALAALITPEAMAERYGREGLAPLLFAVGDGNHSLATAKTAYEELKAKIGAEAAAKHPARYALVEVVNLHDPALDFEPIYRVVMGADDADLLTALRAYCEKNGNPDLPHADFTAVIGGSEVILSLPSTHVEPVGTLQQFLDEYLKTHPEMEVDYIHDESSLRALAEAEGTVGFLFRGMEKGDLFPAIVAGGPLPRKTFSMGHARDKRYYLEARKIK